MATVKKGFFSHNVFTPIGEGSAKPVKDTKGKDTKGNNTKGNNTNTTQKP